MRTGKLDEYPISLFSAVLQQDISAKLANDLLLTGNPIVLRQVVREQL